jgi:Cu/Ag efflux pump CusA
LLNHNWRYIDIIAKRDVIGRYGLTVDDVNSVEAAIGGMTLTTTIEGRERFPSMPVMHRNIEAVLKD